MTATAGRTLAQAKINLALRVLERQADGFHSIETVFLRLDFGDDVRVRIRKSGRTLKCEALHRLAPEENLAYRAAAAYSAATGWPGGFVIDIDKRIPVGGGLGGGSADAAAVLRILNRLAPVPLTTTQLLELAGGLGSDVPFLASEFVMAIAWGRGEIMTRLPPLPSTDIQLIVPAFGISTADAYDALDTARSGQGPVAPALTVEMFRTWHDVLENSVNDFEEVVRDRFAAGGLAPMLYGKRNPTDRSLVRMTGSGSTIFVVQNVAQVSPDRAAVPRSSHNTPALRMARVSLDTKIITTRTSTSVVPVELLD
ncbi:MAG TPA: 4-(cytidine 5'-diphospho)-2-C-methyl-D-erythritol kinase [Gemmatimonadaceae bacterium]|nr:4-(cytidine 5'-diphospho)-2-C-methyl-D-erythritol kinase [Gemmatimonadaceae bacterium]